VLIIALVVWVFRGTVQKHLARAFAVAGLLLTLNEALLGALLVKLGYVTGNQSIGRMVMLSIHLSNTLLLVAALTLTARFLSPRQLSSSQPWASLSNARGFGWVLGGLATTIGVGVSGSMAALGDTLFPAPSLQAAFAQDFAANSPWILRLRLVHPASALVAAVFVIWLIGRSQQANPHGPDTREATSGFLTRMVLALLVVQFALGIADVVLLAPAWMQLLHLLGADLYWVALVLLAAETIWPVTSTSVARSSVPAHSSSLA
jgi:cytochrome c oxidase assembly protein subunit 15